MNYPSAYSRLGPSYKQNGGQNSCHGVICHSMVGSFAGAMGRLDSNDPDAQVSWHYSVLQNGDVYAHYPDEAQCWHAGSKRNDDLIGIEHEGGYSPENEPLTPRQRDASVALVRWLALEHAFPLVRGVGLFEHNEVTATSTQCPSGRIPWDSYTEEHMASAEYEELKAADQDIEKIIVAKNGEIQKAIQALAVANAGSFKAIEDRLAKLEAK